MNSATYICIQGELADFARRLRHMPLDEFIAMAEKADALGAIFNPTLYRVAAAPLADVLLLARAARLFCNACARMNDEWLTLLAHPCDEPEAPAQAGTPWTCLGCGAVNTNAICRCGDHRPHRAIADEGPKS